MWSASALSKTASVMGTPLYADWLAALDDRISYARLLIEVDARNELSKEVSVYFSDGRRYMPEVYYR